DALDAAAARFAAAYLGTIGVDGGPDAEHLRQALEEYERLQDESARPAVYASLVFNADTSPPAHRDLQQRVEQRLTQVRNQLLFFDLEWLAIDDAAASRLSDDPALAPYQHYLQAARREKPHVLSEPEERIVNEKDVTGSSAWQRLFAELTSSLSFPVEIDGATQQQTLAATLTLMRHPDRALRQRAFESLYAVLETQQQTLAYIYNTLIQDKLTMDRLRAYPDPMFSRHLANEIEPEAVQAMMSATEASYDIAQGYFRLKAKLLDLPRLQIYDQYAPLERAERKISYDEGRAIVLDALGGFDARFRDIAAEFFEKNWIDAALRPGKRGGAFCMGYPPSNHPYILCNYTDDMRDVMTVAHELGHGIHSVLARKQTLLNFGPTLPVAETASVFAEMLVFEHLLAGEQDRATRLGLICGKIEDSFATVFRQNVLTRFEQAAFAGRAQGRLTPEQLGDTWLAANGAYYGDAVEQTPGYGRGWSYIPHFINSPFYCYSYVFGELLVLALYATYREEGAAFVPKYVALLEAGGSQSPAAMLAALSVDARDPAFWQRGLNELRRLVA
ncbi:MAG: M3 family oligoendopeptidase, partial [Chloroflexales bacterium]|nr:M3 family oligoendopeptidase [Chloroflexales bacterium]